MIPDQKKPVPLIVTPLIVSAVVPDEVSVMAFVMVVFSGSVPNPTLAALIVIAAADDDGFNCTVVVSEMPFDVAVSVTVCGELTADTVAVNGSLVSSVHTSMAVGTLTDALLLVSVTARMPDVLRLIVTVQVVVPALLKAPGLQDRPESTAEEPKETSGKQAKNRLSRPARRPLRRPR
jgi:hypothetical protein